jgi:hypothetical protein
MGQPASSTRRRQVGERREGGAVGNGTSRNIEFQRGRDGEETRTTELKEKGRDVAQDKAQEASDPKEPEETPRSQCCRVGADQAELKCPGEGSTQIITAKGFCLNDENGQYLASLCEQMGRLGVSADVAVEESEIEVTDVDEIGFPIEMNDELTKGTIMAFTACPMPAFEGACIGLGDGSEQPERL